MKKKLWIIIPVAVLLLGGLAVLLLSRQEPTPEPQPTVLQETEPTAAQETEPTAAQETEPDKVAAPDFTVYDIEGNEVHLSDFLGKPVVLNFWASWCGPCKMEMPDFDEKYRTVGTDVAFLMVNLTDNTRESVETASEFIAQMGYEFPVYYDTKSVAALTYGIRSIPTTYFIDAEGYALAQATGAIDAQTLQKGIDLILPPE